MPEVEWLAECSVAALREALAAVAPELSGYPLTVPGPLGKQDPLSRTPGTAQTDTATSIDAWAQLIPPP